MREAAEPLSELDVELGPACQRPVGRTAGHACLALELRVSGEQLQPELRRIAELVEGGAGIGRQEPAAPGVACEDVRQEIGPSSCEGRYQVRLENAARTAVLEPDVSVGRGDPRGRRPDAVTDDDRRPRGPAMGLDPLLRDYECASMKASVRRHASSDASWNSSCLRSKKLCGAPSYSTSSYSLATSLSVRSNPTLSSCGIAWSAPPCSARIGASRRGTSS